MINRGFDNVGQAGPSGSSEPDAISDSLSDFNFSDTASMLSETASRRGGPVDEARLAANRQRIAQNKAKFEAIKAERNNFKAEARRAAKELERMRAEVSKVEELKSQLRNLQEARARASLSRSTEFTLRRRNGCSALCPVCSVARASARRNVCIRLGEYVIDCLTKVFPSFAGYVHVTSKDDGLLVGRATGAALRKARGHDLFVSCQFSYIVAQVCASDAALCVGGLSSQSIFYEDSHCRFVNDPKAGRQDLSDRSRVRMSRHHTVCRKRAHPVASGRGSAHPSEDKTP